MRKIFIALLISVLLFSCQKKQEVHTDTLPDQTKIKTGTLPQEKKPSDSVTIMDNQQGKETVLTQAELWSRYKTARKNGTAAKDNGNMGEAKDSLIKAAEYAQLLDRDDIAAWQLNNAAYYTILDFKTKTQYEQRMGMINGMPEGNIKKQLIKETRTEFNKHIELLEASSQLLEKAYDLDSQYQDAERTEKIYSNIKYVDWVTNFIKINN